MAVLFSHARGHIDTAGGVLMLTQGLTAKVMADLALHISNSCQTSGAGRSVLIYLDKLETAVATLVIHILERLISSEHNSPRFG